jgi:hypothetical protein
MKVVFRPGKPYRFDRSPQDQTEYLMKVPQVSHRFKRGSGTCCFDHVQYCDFLEKPYKYVLIIDPASQRALAFEKEKVVKTIKIYHRHKIPLYVAELMDLYKSGDFFEIGEVEAESGPVHADWKE